MILNTLEQAGNVINDKITRIRGFEKWVDEQFSLDEKRNFKKSHLKDIFEESLNPHAKELYLDIDEVVSDKERATKIKEEIESHLSLQDSNYVGYIGLDSVNYYNSSRCESDCQYSQVYYYLIPFFNEETGNWSYREKTLYLAEIVNYICEFINRCERTIKEIKNNELK